MRFILLVCLLLVSAGSARTEPTAPLPRAKPPVGPAGDAPVAPNPVAPRPDDPPPDGTTGTGVSALSCHAGLRRLGVDFTVPPTTETSGSCHVDDPVVLDGITAKTATVTLPAKPLLTCSFALSFARWTADIAGPVVKGHDGRALAAISTGPGYVCRNRGGGDGGKISEHALGNAIDIDAFVLDDGVRIPVSAASDAGSPAYPMLTALRLSACGYFTTVLGPGSDDDHADHLHVDSAVRGTSGNYRICQ